MVNYIMNLILAIVEFFRNDDFFDEDEFVDVRPLSKEEMEFFEEWQYDF